MTPGFATPIARRPNARRGLPSARLDHASGKELTPQGPAGRLSRAPQGGSVSAFGFRASALLLGLALVLPTTAQGQSTPRIGYVYPAGGKQGTTFQVTFGGQFLVGVTNVFASGEGVRARILEYNRPMNPKEFNELREQLKVLQEKRRAANQAARVREVPAAEPGSTNGWTTADEKRLAEIKARMLKNPPNRQGNPAIAETVVVQVVLAAEAERGNREVRLVTSNGLSNPLLFRVGALPEFSKPPGRIPTPELDRLLGRFGQPPAKTPSKSEMRVTLPAVLNGQILPGAADRFRFAARQHQQLVVAVSARELIPYLPDAVPGWFQAAVTLYDAKGKELAYNDDYRFHPDPVLHYEVPKDGDYEIEIKDAIYRGREDFVYRVTLGELPFVVSRFPLGGRAGSTTSVTMKGWNLGCTNRVSGSPAGTAMTEFSEVVTFAEPGLQLLRATNGTHLFNPVPFDVDTLPECLEQEPNGSVDKAQPITLPIIINGRIDESGDADVFRFEGHAGERVVAEVHARRLDSPVDSVLQLTDAAGKQIAFNDDHEDRGSGLDTHHADSYLAASLPADGAYYVHVGDTQRQGGSDYAYRLRLSAPRPDFALRVVPASVTFRAGMSVPLTVYALRQDGFTNQIRLELKDAPAGFQLAGGGVPANQSQVRLTLKAPATPRDEPFHLTLQGWAIIGGKTTTLTAVPAEDMMQAFAYRHLVPAQDLSACVLENRRPLAMAGVRILSPTPIQIPAGGTARVRFATPGRVFLQRFDLELSMPPEGVTLSGVSPTDDGGELTLECDASKVSRGQKGNLIVNLAAGTPPAGSQPKRPQGNQRRPVLGTLPAIPFEITGP
jgi:hypothetical protein